MEDYLIFNSGEIIEADFAQFWRRIHSGRGIFHDELVGRVYRGHGPDAFPCAADADALSEAHHRQDAVRVLHGKGVV